MTKIEWVKSADGSQGKTWNPFAGCAVVTPGCTNCYAMKMAARLDAMGQPLYKGLTKPSKGGPVWRGTVRANPDVLLAPLKRKKPTTYFVNSMSDLFYEKFSDELIDKVFAVMALSPQHTFQVLTKRAERMREYVSRKLADAGKVMNWPDYAAQYRAWMAMPKVDAAANGCAHPQWPLPNVWLGVSAERQQEADERIPLLLQTPAAVRFVSAEPLIGPIDFKRIQVAGHGWQDVLNGWRDCKDYPGRENVLDWIIVGGESGPRAREFDMAWARSIIDQCKVAGVSCFVKQLGARVVGPHANGVNQTIHTFKSLKGGDWSEWPDDLRVREFPIRARSAGSLPLTIAGNEPGGRAGAVSK